VDLVDIAQQSVLRQSHGQPAIVAQTSWAAVSLEPVDDFRDTLIRAT